LRLYSAALIFFCFVFHPPHSCFFRNVFSGSGVGCVPGDPLPQPFFLLSYLGSPPYAVVILIAYCLHTPLYTVCSCLSDATPRLPRNREGLCVTRTLIELPSSSQDNISEVLPLLFPDFFSSFVVRALFHQWIVASEMSYHSMALLFIGLVCGTVPPSLFSFRIVSFSSILPLPVRVNLGS